MRRSGMRSRRMIVSLFRGSTSASPGTEGRWGTVPVLITTSAPRTTRRPPSFRSISTVRSATKRAVPRTRSIPLSRNWWWLRFTMSATTPSLWERSMSRSTSTLPRLRPSDCAVAARRTSRELVTRDLVGMHATLMHVPPIMPRSTMTTLRPARARSMARVFPALPPPTTNRSTSSTTPWESVMTVRPPQR